MSETRSLPCRGNRSVPFEKCEHQAADHTNEEAKEAADLIRGEVAAEQGAGEDGGGVLLAEAAADLT